jgi:hypothetical protein
MGLPNADRAQVDPRKLTDYCLSPEHPVGKHKAALFRAALGVTAADAGTLRDALLRAAATGEAVTCRADEFGQRYVIDFEMTTPAGTATVRSAWIVGPGEDHLRLTTCYIHSG